MASFSTAARPAGSKASARVSGALPGSSRVAGEVFGAAALAAGSAVESFAAAGRNCSTTSAREPASAQNDPETRSSPPAAVADSPGCRSGLGSGPFPSSGLSPPAGAAVETGADGTHPPALGAGCRQEAVSKSGSQQGIWLASESWSWRRRPFPGALCVSGPGVSSDAVSTGAIRGDSTPGLRTAWLRSEAKRRHPTAGSDWPGRPSGAGEPGRRAGVDVAEVMGPRSFSDSWRRSSGAGDWRARPRVCFPPCCPGSGPQESGPTRILSSTQGLL